MQIQNQRLISSGLTATSAMTLFSYLVTEAKKKNFKEPEVLAQFIEQTLPTIEDEVALPAGWLLHYGMGFTFAAVYRVLWEKTKFRPGILNGLVIGGISGLIGITVWKTLFKIHPNPPEIHLGKYLGHLMLAHLIFGVMAAEGYKLPETFEKEK